MNPVRPLMMLLIISFSLFGLRSSAEAQHAGDPGAGAAYAFVKRVTRLVALTYRQRLQRQRSGMSPLHRA
jgi:hypothetical protein